MIFPLRSTLGPLGRKYGGGLWSGWAGIQHCWHVDETSGTRYDAVGAAHLTDNNTVGYDTGKHNNAANFVATNGEYLNYANALVPGSGDWTIAVWYKDNALGGAVVSDRNVANQGAGLYTWNDNTLYAYVGYGTGEKSLTRSSVSGNWHLAILSYTSSTRTILLSVDDGTSATDTLGGDFSGGTGIFTIGLNIPPTIYYDGLIDEVAIFNEAKDAAWRTAIYNAGAGRFYPD